MTMLRMFNLKTHHDDGVMLLRHGTAQVMKHAESALVVLQTIPGSEQLTQQIKSIVEELRKLDSAAVSRNKDQVMVSELISSIESKINAITIPAVPTEGFLERSIEGRQNFSTGVLSQALTGMQNSLKDLKAESHTRAIHNPATDVRNSTEINTTPTTPTHTRPSNR